MTAIPRQKVELEIIDGFQPAYEDFSGWDLKKAAYRKNRKPKKRYMKFKGGRGGAKSTQVSRALAFNMTKRPTNCFYGRQIEKTIDDSVRELLIQQIDILKLPGFKVLSDRVFWNRLRHDESKVIFRGIRDFKTAIGVKSIENINLMILEEAQAFTADVLDILFPCVRGRDSQIWAVFNPFEETDAIELKIPNDPRLTYQLFINYDGNPFFPESLELELENDRKLVSIGYRTQEWFDNIWHGEPIANNPMGLCNVGSVNYCASNTIDFETAARTLHELESKVGNRIEHLQRLLVPLKDRRAVGVDTGLHGDDPAVMVMVNETQAVKWKSIPHCTGTHLFNAVKEFVNFDKKIMINMDASNEEGICDFFKADGYNLNAIKFAGQAKRNVHGDYVKGTSDLYLNARQEMAFELRYLVNNRLIQIPDDHLLKVQLKNYEYSEKIVNTHVILELEPKKNYKKRMGHSPDFFDALGLAMYTPFSPALPGIG
jgi:hypothetical protein